jgi:hypothetical protein
MVRPKSFLASLFDLGDREVSRKYVNPFDKKKDDKTAAAPKGTEIPKPAAAAAKAVAKKADDKKKEEEKKPTVEMNVVSADATNRIADSDVGSGGGAAEAGGVAADNNKKDKAQEDTKKMTADQWRSLVLGQPNSTNVNKMVAAYMAKELSDTEFYGIVKELLHNSNTETQGLGLSAVSSFYNSNAFAVTAESYSVLPQDLQTKADAYLLGYANSGRLGILASSLKSTSTTVVSLAAQLVVKGYQNAKSNVVTTDARNRTGSTNSVASYTQFVAIFQSLSQSTDSEIASLANSALSQIQTGVASL